MKLKLFSYNYCDTPIHRMSGVTKFLCFLLLTFGVMFSFDIRVICFVLVFSVFTMKLAEIKFSQIKVMVYYVLAFIVINAVITYLFSPEEGVKIYGTRHELVKFFGSYTITQEQVLYQATKLLKYVSVIPLGMIFFLTTNPSEFAASLNFVKIGYRAAFAVALTLRYFPDIQRNYTSISQAQQARGLEMTKKAKLADRFKNTTMILVPLIFSSLEKAEVISNAMDLRGFGKRKKRTWYARRPIQKLDILAIVICSVIFLLTIAVSVFVNNSRFFNPFI